MQELNLIKDVIVLVTGSDSKRSICAVQEAECDGNKILMNRLVRHNLGVLVNDPVMIQSCSNIQTGNYISIALNYCDSARGITRDICKELLNQYFMNYRCVLHEGNKFIVRGGMRAVEFVVLKTEPGPYCIVDVKSITKINFVTKLEKYKEGESKLSDISYDDIGGYDIQLAQLRELEYPLTFPNLFTEIKAVSPRVILHGPQGVGKLLMARAFANENKAHLVLIDETILKNISRNMCVIKLQKKFEEAKNNSPSILCFNGLDVITPKMATTEEHNILTKELTNQIKQLDKERNYVVLLMGIASQINQICDSILLQFYNSKMDKHIMLGYPEYIDRIQILKVHTRNLKLICNFDYTEIAKSTENYSSAALARLCTRAALWSKKSNGECLISSDDEITETNSLLTQIVTNLDFLYVMNDTDHH